MTSNSNIEAEIEWKDGVPCSKAFDDVYFSKEDGLAESTYVFIDQNNLSQRFQSLQDEHFTIVETGFGTGLNFLLTLRFWLDNAPKTARLHFVSIEKHPISVKDLPIILSNWPSLSDLSSLLADQWPSPIPGTHRLQFFDGRASLTLLYYDVEAALQSQNKLYADAWFLDGFAPSKNPDMWSPALFRSMRLHSKLNATFATFTAAGIVKRGLSDVGWQVHKISGFGRKRDMLRGFLSESDAKEFDCPKDIPKWANLNGISKQTNSESVIVIGAGLAGATTALALARKGRQVILLESSAQLAAGASGTAQLATFIKLPAEPNKISRFHISGLSFSSRFYSSEQDKNTLPFWDKCGLVHLAWNAKEQETQQRVIKSHELPETFVKPVDQFIAQEITGLEVSEGGLYFQDAGWLEGNNFVQTCVDHPNIQTHFNSTVIDLNLQAETWRVRCSNGNEFIAGSVVVTAANGSRELEQIAHLPIKPLRGQVSIINDECAQTPKSVVCGEGYLCPAKDNEIQFGATYDLSNVNIDVLDQDHQKNLDSIRRWLPNWLPDSFQDSKLEGKAGIRCTTNDYTPIVGPATDLERTLIEFGPLRTNAKSCSDKTLPCWPGLFVNVGHGSKGASTIPLASEYLASLIAGEPLPIDSKTWTLLHPGRFVVKSLIQGKI